MITNKDSSIAATAAMRGARVHAVQRVQKGGVIGDNPFDCRSEMHLWYEWNVTFTQLAFQVAKVKPGDKDDNPYYRGLLDAFPARCGEPCPYPKGSAEEALWKIGVEDGLDLAELEHALMRFLN